MAQEVLLVNPRRRRRKATTTTKRRRRRNPATQARRTPVRRRRRTTARRRKNPASLSRITRRLRPRGIAATVTPAITAAAGAVGIEAAYNMLPIPAQWKAGNLRYVVKALAAIVLGEMAKTVVSAKTADQFVMGALTVVIYEAGKEVASNMVPGLNLGYYSAGLPVGYDGVSGYLPGNASSFPIGMNACPPVKLPCPAAASAPGMGAYLSGGYDYD